MGKPNKQWGSSECVRGGAGSKHYRAAKAFVKTPRKAVGGYQRKKKKGGFVLILVKQPMKEGQAAVEDDKEAVDSGGWGMEW